MASQAGAHGIEFDVAAAGEEIRLAVDRRRAIAPFPQRSSPSIVRWLRILEQNFRADKWNLCQGYAASRSGSFVKYA